MRHQDLTLNHRLESFVYADTAAREAAVGLVSGDEGRIAYQTDTGQYWRLTDWSPVTWQAFGPVYAYTQTTGTNSPTGTTSTSNVMMGLGSIATITPTATGKILATFVGNISNATASINCFAVMTYDTGSAPVNGAAGTGTALGSQARLTGVRAAGVLVPVTFHGVVTGAVLGDPLWFDIALATGATGTVSVSIVQATLVEIP